MVDRLLSKERTRSLRIFCKCIDLKCSLSFSHLTLFLTSMNICCIYLQNKSIHFEPTGHSLRHDAKMADEKQDVHAKYKDALNRGVGGHESDNNHGLPSYIKAGTPEESHWRAAHPAGQTAKKVSTSTTGSTIFHTAAQTGDIATLRRELQTKKEGVHAKDTNGWTVSEELLLVRWGWFIVLNTSNHYFMI
jgi:hypothetical protein